MEPHNIITQSVCFDELRDKILTSSKNSSLDIIHQTRQDMNTILLELHSIHNSKIAINRVIPDILYDIFMLVLYDSAFPGTTVLNISHVCRHWRNLALGWPSLWGYVDLSARSLVPLFLVRSDDAPITFSWTTRFHYPLFERQSSIFDSNSNPKMRNLFRSSKLYFESLAGHILHRLRFLILHLTSSEFTEIQHVFEGLKLTPLRLRSLDLGLYYGTSVNDKPLWTSLLPLEESYLRELKLREVALPWFTPPHNQLSHFSIHYPKRPPSFDQLMMFLSECPRLTGLEIGLSDDVPETFPSPERTNEFSTQHALKSNELNFPYLRKLELSAMGQKSFELIQLLTRCIKNMGSLSCFNLKYDYETINLPLSEHPFDIFELVPSETFSHFTGHHYLCINLYRHSGNFTIYSGPGPHPRTLPQSGFRRSSHSNKQLFPLYISGLGRPGPLFDYTPISQLIRFMPEITHLELVSSAWELFTAWKIDCGTVFPCLHTLELADHHHPVRDCAVVLSSLSRCQLKLETLILKRARVESSDVLFDAVCRIGVKVLELGEFYVEVEYRVITALRERGIVVILPEEPVFQPVINTLTYNL